MAVIRLSKVLKELNVGLEHANEALAASGDDVQLTRNSKITPEQHEVLIAAFETDKSRKVQADAVSQQKLKEKEAMRAERDMIKGVEHVPADEAKVTTEPAEKKEEESPQESVKKEEVKEEVKKEEPITKEEEVQVEPEETPKVEAKEEQKPEAKEEEKVEKPAEEKPKVKEEKEEAPKDTSKEAKEKKDDNVTGKIKLEGVKKLGTIDLDKLEKAKKKAKPTAKKATKKAESPKPEKEETVENVVEVEAKSDVKKEATPEAKTEKTEAKTESPAEEVDNNIETQYAKLSGPKLTGQTIDLTKFNKPKKKKVASSEEAPGKDGKKKRRRIVKDNKVGDDKKPGQKPARGRRGDTRKRVAPKVELTDEQIQKQIKETLEKLTGGRKSKSAKNRRDKRMERKGQEALDEMQREEEEKTLKITEYATATDLANMMGISVTEIISALMGIGLMVTMNQRLDAETLEMVAQEFGYKVEFTDSDVTEVIQEEEDDAEDLEPRAPIVTVMGHVDHGKTSLLDYIRETNVIAGEAGGITQHIGAYSVKIATGDRIAFLDTPGHEAFTAMRARGAQVTDIAIIVVAADDAVMPQTKEAISHAQAAGVPIVFAINKVDRPNSNPEKIKEQLAQMNLLVEDWGGKIQSQDVSAKTGEGIKELLEKVLLEAELLDLKANPDKNATGTIVEASLDKGRGYLSTIMVQNGTLKIGDYVLAGQYSGKVKAMLDERNRNVKEAAPSTPVSLLGLDGAPQAGDTFLVMNDEREAKQLANKRTQLAREHSARSQKSLTLEEIGRRLAVGEFQELNIILKGDVDGSIEALSDSLQKLSTEEIHVQIVHKGVGQITESDVLLASASNAIIVGFQVRPSGSARKIAEKENVEIRLYSIIYDAINDIKDAMEGMLSAEVKEEIVGTAEIRETFKISKVGTIAGCMVTDGKLTRSSQIRLIRDGVVIYSGLLGSLKRFKDDAKEVAKGYECGLNIQNYNDIKVGDVVEAFEHVEVKRTLE